MPAIRYYEVEQTRSVRVEATSISDAMLAANREFAKAAPITEPVPEEDIQARVRTHVEITGTTIRKEL